MSHKDFSAQLIKVYKNSILFFKQNKGLHKPMEPLKIFTNIKISKAIYIRALFYVLFMIINQAI